VKVKGKLTELYQRLLAYYGPQNWWPGDTPLEVMVGAVLTQNTSWAQAAKAIANLKKAKVLDLNRLKELPLSRLAQLIRPAGYYNLKAQRLRNLLDLIFASFGGDLPGFLAAPLPEARRALLSTKGIGPETADSILLYAAGRPIFVIDAYTHRILGRHHMAAAQMTYHDLQKFFMDNLPADADIFNEFHALLVRLGKERCKKNGPVCEGCPAQGWWGPPEAN
jgi:endonuclease-3 related protein